MESWRYLVIIGGSLLVAAYMFSSLFFPKLRWIFRLKRGPSYAFGVDNEQNDKIANSLGLILAPIIGIAALGFAGTIILDWRSSIKRDIEMQETMARRKIESEALLKQALTEWKVVKVYQGIEFERREGNEDGIKQAEEFVRLLATQVGSDMISDGSASIYNKNGISIKLANETATLPQDRFPLILHYDKINQSLAVQSPHSDKAEKLNISSEMQQSLSALGKIEIIDQVAADKARMRERINQQRENR